MDIEPSVMHRAVEPLREVVLDIFCAGGNTEVRKADVSRAAQERDIAFQDSAYQRVMKELCRSRGGSWSLKPAHDD